jgi:hypothetical protein
VASATERAMVRTDGSENDNTNNNNNNDNNNDTPAIFFTDDHECINAGGVCVLQTTSRQQIKCMGAPQRMNE